MPPAAEGDRVSVSAWHFDDVPARKDHNVDRWSYQHFGAAHWRYARCYGIVSKFVSSTMAEVIWTDDIWRGGKDEVRCDWLRREDPVAADTAFVENLRRVQQKAAAAKDGTAAESSKKRRRNCAPSNSSSGSGNASTSISVDGKGKRQHAMVDGSTSSAADASSSPTTAAPLSLPARSNRAVFGDADARPPPPSSKVPAPTAALVQPAATAATAKAALSRAASAAELAEQMQVRQQN